MDAATSEQTRIAAAATDKDKDASTSGPTRTAAAATAGHQDAATSYKLHRQNVLDLPSRTLSHTARHRKVLNQ